MRAGWNLSCPANASKKRSDCDVCWQSTHGRVTGCPARGHCARTKSDCVLSASDVETIQEAQTITIVKKRQHLSQPLTLTRREWWDTGTPADQRGQNHLVGEAAAGGEQEIPTILVSRAPERAPPTTHDYPDAWAQSDFLQDDLPDDFPGPVMSAPAIGVALTRRGIPRSGPARSTAPSNASVSLFVCVNATACH
jgi:hypothetical protein